MGEFPLWGFINKKGEDVIKPEYNQVKSFREGVASVTYHPLKQSTSYIDKKGKYVNIPQSYCGYSFYNGIAITSNQSAGSCGDKEGFITKEKIIIEPIFDNVYNFSEGLAAVEYNGKWGYIKLPKKHFFF